jgi:uncharacterized protein YqjF (DUF2071 family)
VARGIERVEGPILSDFDRLLERAAHRPWPLPARRWSFHMRWRDLLLAHWPVPIASLAPRIPAGLQLDTFAGQAFVGLVPFRMEAVGPRGLARFPGMTAFPEVNVRTYVVADDKPGVFFFSLDAASPLAVLCARSFVGLPYRLARVRVTHEQEEVVWSSHRLRVSGRLSIAYAPCGPLQLALPGTLDHWVSERYCLYSRAFGRTLRIEVHHEPWPLQPARAEISEETLLAAAGISVSGPPVTLHFASRMDVVGWSPERIGDETRSSAVPRYYRDASNYELDPPDPAE